MASFSAPLVSVIIAFLNEEKFLDEAIDSVIEQTYPNWELLLIDDGSTDGSMEIARNYVSRFPEKIFYLEHENHGNKGVTASRNLGIKKAKGELIALLDADDIWLPQKLARQVAIFQQHPETGMVAEASEYWYSWKYPEKPDKRIPVGAPQNQLFAPGELLAILYPLSSGQSPCPSSLMLTRNALQRAGGFEESFQGKFQLYEDQAFLFKIYLREHVFISSDYNFRYRQREGSCVQQVSAAGQYKIVRKYFLDWLVIYLEKENINDPVLNKLVYKAFLPYHSPKLHFFTQILPGRMGRMFKKSYKKLMQQQWQNSPF